MKMYGQFFSIAATGFSMVLSTAALAQSETPLTYPSFTTPQYRATLPGALSESQSAPLGKLVYKKSDFFTEGASLVRLSKVSAQGGPVNLQSEIAGRTEIRVQAVAFRKAWYTDADHYTVLKILPVKMLVTFDSTNPGLRNRNLEMVAAVLAKSLFGDNPRVPTLSAEANVVKFQSELLGQRDDYATRVNRIDLASIRFTTGGNSPYAYSDHRGGSGLILDLEYAAPATLVWMDDLIVKHNATAAAMQCDWCGFQDATPGWVTADSSYRRSWVLGVDNGVVMLTFGSAKDGFTVERTGNNQSKIVTKSEGAQLTYQLGMHLNPYFEKLEKYGKFDVFFVNHAQGRSIQTTVQATVPDPQGLLPEAYFDSFYETWTQRSITIRWTLPRNWKLR